GPLFTAGTTFLADDPCADIPFLSPCRADNCDSADVYRLAKLARVDIVSPDPRPSSFRWAKTILGFHDRNAGGPSVSVAGYGRMRREHWSRCARLVRSLCMDAASRLAGRSESGPGDRAQDDSRIVRTLFPVETAMENCLCRNPLRPN